MADFNSYAEVSPSGSGVHICASGAPTGFKMAALPMPGERVNGKQPQIEAWTDQRYATVTGDRLPDAPDNSRGTGSVGAIGAAAARPLSQREGRPQRFLLACSVVTDGAF